MKSHVAVIECHTHTSGQRLDVWLYRTRLLKTRSLATKMIKGGKIRLTRHGQTIRASKPHTCLRPTDCIAFMRGTELVQVEMVATALKRGSACEAEALYNLIDYEAVA